MKRRSLVEGVALVGVAVILATGARAAGAGAPRVTRTAAQALNPAPRTWHVVVGFTQMLPRGNGSPESANQFYPRTLTIYPGDRVTFTDNATNEPHTVTFGPDRLLRPLEDPTHDHSPQVVDGKKLLVLNRAKWFRSAPDPLVETDRGSATHLLNCGLIGPAGTPGPQSCTVTFPYVGTYTYECLLHSGIPGMADMDGVIKVIPRPQPTNHTWTVQAGTGSATDTLNGFVPAQLTIRVGDRVTWTSGGVHLHTVSFGLDPRTTPLFVPAGTDKHGPVLAWNPRVFDPIVPKDGIYQGGVASSGVAALTGNYANLPGQTFLQAPFTLTFTKPGVYRYYCLIHPGMAGTITVLARGAA